MKDKGGSDWHATTVRDFEACLLALDADGLREFVRLSTNGNETMHERLIEHAARKLNGLALLEPDPRLLDDAKQAVRAARRKGQSATPEIRTILLRARRLFLRGDLLEAQKTYEAILGLAADSALGDAAGEVPGESDEPLDADAESELGFPQAGSYLASVYEAAAPAARVDAMLDAVERLSAVEAITSPIAAMVAHAVRPLSGLSAFTEEWASLLEAIAEGTRGVRATWSPSQAMLAEALERLEGVEGVSRIARRTGDLAHYRTWAVRVANEGRLRDAIEVAVEAGERLPDAFGRGVMLDAGVALAEKLRDHARSVRCAEDAFAADPSTGRLARWMLLGHPKRTVLLERASSASKNYAQQLTPRMKALLAALRGSVDALVELLDRADDAWERDEHPGPIAFPALLLALYGGPKGTPVSARVCSPLFATKADAGWRGWTPPNSIFGEPPTPDPGPFIVEATSSAALQSSSGFAEAPHSLRRAAALRAAAILSTRDRAAFDSTAALVVAAAESTYRVGHHDVARAYLGEVALAAARHPPFRAALTKTLAKSALVNAL